MGLFAGRSARFDHVAIAEAMRPSLYGFFNARLQIFDPNIRGITQTFNPYTDTGGKATPGLLHDTGLNGALVQPIRSPVTVEYGDQTVGIIGIRFQLVRPPDALALRAGLRIKVIDGGNDSELTERLFTINEGIDASITWGKTIEASTVTSGSP